MVNVADSFYQNTLLESHMANWIISGDKKNTFKGESYLGCCKLENEILKEAKNLEK